jgi:hypothetical protein
MRKENYLSNIYDILHIDLPITEDKINYYVNHLKNLYGYAPNEYLFNCVKRSMNSINEGYDNNLKDNLRGLYYNQIGLDVVHYQYKNIHIIYEDLKYSSYREALKNLK